MEKDQRSVPPEWESEVVLLGGILLHPSSIAEVVDIVKPRDFLHPAREAIFQAMVDLYRASWPIDEITVLEQMASVGTYRFLEESGRGELYFEQYKSVVVDPVNVVHHARVVRRGAAARRLVEAARELTELTRDDETTERLSRSVGALNLPKCEIDSTPLQDVLTIAFKDLERRYGRKELITGVSSGFPKLDALTCGFQPSELIVVAACPSMGKTAFASNVVVNAALEHGIPCLMFSADLSQERLVERMLASMASVESNRLSGGFLEQRDWINLTKAATRLAEAHVWINAAGSPTLSELWAATRRWRSERTLFKTPEQHGLVVIDFLQLLVSTDGKASPSRQREIAEICHSLKALAVELRVPVIVLVHLDAERLARRSNHKPWLSDLRREGPIEHDADLVLFLYRDALYENRSKNPRLAEVVIGKQRSGPTGTVQLTFLGEYLRFENIDDGEDPFADS